MWYGFRFFPDGSDGSPGELGGGRTEPPTEHYIPWTLKRGLGGVGWKWIVMNEHVVLAIASSSKHEAEFILWVRKP